MSSGFTRRAFLGGVAALAAGGASLLSPRTVRAAAGKLDRLGIDYAYYNPPSLVLKKFGWLESELSKQGTQVEWVLSLGSNKANEFLAANAVQFGSTAGSAALLARINDSPIQTVFLYSRPEWTALVVGKDSSLKSVRDLRGKRVAATRGTDPWFFLLRALHANGLSQSDVEVVNLQHPDGRTALVRGQVDAWAGLDPHMAAAQLEDGARLLYRNINFNTYGALNAREDLLRDHPDVVATVLRTYDRARRYAAAHPDETSQILADASHLELRVAEVEIRQRTQYPDPTPGASYQAAIAGVLPIIRDEHLAAPGSDPQRALATLSNPRPAHAALASRA